jgi:ribonuclease HI
LGWSIFNLVKNMIDKKDLFAKIINHKKFDEILNELKIENNLKQEIKKEFLKYFDINEEKELELNLEFDSENIIDVLRIFSDGACSGNPGVSGIGCVIFDENNKEIARENKFIGETTNNFAEYSAIILALDNIEELKNDNFFKIGIDKIKFEFFADSELMVNQLNGKYKISNLDLQKLALKFKNKIAELGIKNYTIKHVMRENNKIADSLAVLAKSKNIVKIRAK